MQNVASVLLAQSLSTTSLFALLPDMQKIWDESLFVFLLHHTCATAMDQEGGAECAVIGPRIELLSPSVRAETQGSPLIHLPQNTWQPPGKTGMALHGKSRSLSLRKSFLTLHVQDIIQPITAAHNKTGEPRGLHHFPSMLTQTNFSIFSQVVT